MATTTDRSPDMTIETAVRVFQGLRGLLQANLDDTVSYMVTRRMDILEGCIKRYEERTAEIRRRYKVPDQVPIGYSFPADYLEAQRKFLQTSAEITVRKLPWSKIIDQKDVNDKKIRIPGEVIYNLSPILEGAPEDF